MSFAAPMVKTLLFSSIPPALGSCSETSIVDFVQALPTVTFFPGVMEVFSIRTFNTLDSLSILPNVALPVRVARYDK